MATTVAVLASRPLRGGRSADPGEPWATTASPMRLQPHAANLPSHRALMALAVAADPNHADELVRETWDHFLDVLDVVAPDRQRLTDYLLDLIDGRIGNAPVSAEAWAARLLARRPGKAGDCAHDGGDRSAAHAELLVRDLYANRAGTLGRVSAPAAWPSISRILRPADPRWIAKLYSAVDAALDELPAELDDALYLIDIEAQPLPVASTALGRDEHAIYTDLVTARARVWSRLSDFFLTNWCGSSPPTQRDGSTTRSQGAEYRGVSWGETAEPLMG